MLISWYSSCSCQVKLHRTHDCSEIKITRLLHDKKLEHAKEKKDEKQNEHAISWVSIDKKRNIFQEFEKVI